MKLYTEEQVKYAIQLAFDVEPPCKVKDILRDLTPIELPSDEEIEKAGWDYELGQIGDGYEQHFIDGAKWYREQLKQRQ